MGEAWLSKRLVGMAGKRVRLECPMPKPGEPVVIADGPPGAPTLVNEDE